MVKLLLFTDLMVGLELGGVVESDFPLEDCEVREGEGGRFELAVEFRRDEVIDIFTKILGESSGKSEGDVTEKVECFEVSTHSLLFYSTRVKRPARGLFPHFPHHPFLSHFWSF